MLTNSVPRLCCEQQSGERLEGFDPFIDRGWSKDVVDLRCKVVGSIRWRTIDHTTPTDDLAGAAFGELPPDDPGLLRSPRNRGRVPQLSGGLTVLAAQYPEVESIGIDTWAVDDGLLGRTGQLLAEPISYRDDRTTDAVRKVHARLPHADLFAINGLQFLPFNTIYQLFADGRGPHWGDTAQIALLPDLLAVWLTGVLRSEYTNATTTGLVDVTTGRWSMRLIDRLGLRASLLPPLEQPGSTRGRLLPAIAARVGLPPSIAVTTGRFA